MCFLQNPSNTRHTTNRLLWHTMWAMIDDMFSSKFMFAPNSSNSCWLCTSDVQGLQAFPGKTSSFLRSGPWAVKTDRLMLDSCYRENASFTLHWAMIAGAEGGGGGGDITLAWVGVTLHSHYSKCFAVGGPLPFIFCGVQRGQQNARQLRKSSGEKLNSIRLYPEMSCKQTPTKKQSLCGDYDQSSLK